MPPEYLSDDSNDEMNILPEDKLIKFWVFTLVYF